ncbi:MAG: hypothetical protein ACTSQP_10730 [Promethearchaeota archaeon]
MIINDFNNKIYGNGFYSKIITIEGDSEDTTYIFPKTDGFLESIQKKKNAEKLHQILKRIKI